MSQDTSSPLSVAITCDRTGYLSVNDAELISELIHRQIASEAKSPDSDSHTPRPLFSSEQLYADRAIKLWCANDQTLTWLKKTVSDLKYNSRQLVVKSQSEIQKRVNCKFEVPKKQRLTYRKVDEINQVLFYQNPWIDLKKCAISTNWDQNQYCYEVIMEIPEDLILTLMKAECRLSFGLTVVYIKFEGPDGTLNSDVPKGWDPVTQTILYKPQKKKLSSKQSSKRKMIPATSSTLSVAITCERTGYLSKSDADTICELIRRQMISEAKSPVQVLHSHTPGPLFSSEQLYADRAIKLWCANDQTLTWLKKTVSDLKYNSRQLVVKSQSEIQKRVNCKFEIAYEQRDSYKTQDEIKQLLCFQNPWIDLKKCALFVEYDQKHRYYNSVMMEIPEDIIPTLMKAERRLSFGLTVVYLKFEGPDGVFNSDVPKGWDPVTQTIL